MPAAAAVVLGAGSGARVGSDANKVFLPLAGRRLISWALNAFLAAPGVVRVVLVIRAEDRAVALEMLDREVGGHVDIVVGGATRHDSEQAALDHLAEDIGADRIDVVAIHDGARPLLAAGVIDDVLTAAALYGAAVPALAVTDVAEVLDGALASVDARQNLVRVQTPQAFAARTLLDAYRRAAEDGFSGGDTSACVEHYGGVVVHTVPGDPRNFKITYAGDLFAAEQVLAAEGYRLR